MFKLFTKKNNHKEEGLIYYFAVNTAKHFVQDSIYYIGESLRNQFLNIEPDDILNSYYIKHLRNELNSCKITKAEYDNLIDEYFENEESNSVDLSLLASVAFESYCFASVIVEMALKKCKIKKDIINESINRIRDEMTRKSPYLEDAYDICKKQDIDIRSLFVFRRLAYYKILGGISEPCGIWLKDKEKLSDRALFKAIIALGDFVFTTHLYDNRWIKSYSEIKKEKLDINPSTECFVLFDYLLEEIPYITTIAFDYLDKNVKMKKSILNAIENNITTYYWSKMLDRYENLNDD